MLQKQQKEEIRDNTILAIYTQPIKKVRLILYTKATPKARPRVVRRGNFSSAYTPKKEFENIVAQEYKKRQYPLYENDLELSINFFFKPAESLTKKKKAQCLEDKWCNNHVLGDLDNLIKSVLDGLNGIAYKDDSQIVKFGEMTKQYAEEDRVEITIKEITNAQREEDGQN